MTADRIKALEDALTLAANRLHRVALDFDTGSRRFIEVFEWADEARAALAASRATSDCQQQGLMTAARVKPLGWSDDPSSALDCAWIDNFGLYQITDEAVLFVGHESTGTQYPTIAAAKAAAQADYEARILAALDLTPAAAVEPGEPTAQDAARVERVAFAMWKAEADRAAPNVGRNRTPKMFSGEADDTRAKWIGLASAALRAIAGGDA